MYEQQTAPQKAQTKTPNAVFETYTESMNENADAPLLGHMVLYSIFDGDITRDDLADWFRELDLDDTLLPPPLRQVDAFERVTGPDGVRVTYPLNDPRATGPAYRRGRRRRNELGKAKTAPLMVRPVRRDGDSIVRHVIREVRNEERSSLKYDTRLAVCTFHRDNNGGSDGAGALQIEPNHAAIAKLPEAEQTTVHEMLTAIEDSYRHRCTYLTSDKLRSLIRRYVERLDAIRVRPTGGVYFVQRQHSPTLAALRELVSRFGQGSNLVRVPLPDQEEMREMVVAAFTTKAKDDLDQLAQEIAEAQRTKQYDAAATLYARFTALQQSTNDHSELLSTSLDETRAALDLVKMQLGGLLATAGDDEPDDE